MLSAASDCTTSTDSPVSCDSSSGLGSRRSFWRRISRRLDDAREIGGAVERHADRAALPRERRENRLTNPPHGVRDELHALVGIELPRGGEQPDVPLADQVDEREAAVLVFLGDGDDEAQVALHELLERVLVAGADLPRELDLLRTLEQRVGADLVEVLVEDVALGLAWERSPAGPRGGARRLTSVMMASY